MTRRTRPVSATSPRFRASRSCTRSSRGKFPELEGELWDTTRMDDAYQEKYALELGKCPRRT